MADNNNNANNGGESQTGQGNPQGNLQGNPQGKSASTGAGFMKKLQSGPVRTLETSRGTKPSGPRASAVPNASQQSSNAHQSGNAQSGNAQPTETVPSATTQGNPEQLVAQEVSTVETGNLTEVVEIPQGTGQATGNGNGQSNQSTGQQGASASTVQQTAQQQTQQPVTNPNTQQGSAQGGNPQGSNPQGGNPQGGNPQGGNPQRIIEITDEDALIVLPGEKPKTVRQLNFERNQGREASRQLGSIDHERRRLEAERLELERERQTLRQQSTQPSQAVQQAAQQPVEQPPTIPDDLLEGTPEYVAAVARVNAYYTAQAVREVNKPLVERFEREDQQREAERQSQESATRLLEANQRTYATVIREHLPFELNGLPEQVQREVFENIRQAGRSRQRPFDLADRQQMSSVELNPDTLEAIVVRLYPEGSLPPGYERTADGNARYVDPSSAAAPVTQSPLEQLAGQAQQPVVPKSQPAPIHQSTTGGGTAQAQVPKGRPAQQRSAFERMGAKWA